MAEDLTALTAELVAAYLRGNIVAVSDVPILIESTYTALVNTTVQEPLPTEHQTPAVPMKKSVTPDAIICLDCGKRQKMLKRHLHTAHNLSVEDYRSKWSLPADYPMVAHDYAARRSQLAITFGLGRKKPDETAAMSEEVKAKTSAPSRDYKYPSSRWSKPSD
ncbi:MucR family transcriptional regulator [Telmatospirillum siberiense]|uniref:MucR family transcriptional regulator n=1 Tax=Telmatospirillum siberiense TaxID=382514 RepID=A0A2N3PRC2_9PROT|nr:MucR family transcriptional regulator [Telmatospirillum siberiense]PKU22946.1 MucR family transcriptional regulator [Telmatospirillum siberiense]